jgi:tripartite-type tricarboxylate transporter receptor subunit TctC
MSQTRRYFLQAAAAAGASSLCRTSASAEIFPDRPIQVLVGGGAGSVPDLVARLVADKLASVLGQPMIVENRPGAGGIIAMQGLLNSKSDGYTLALASMSQLVFNSYLFSKLPYDPRRDVAPIATLAIGALTVAAHPSVAANTLGEFVREAKAHPGQFAIGTASNGSPPDLVARLFVHTAGIDVRFVPFRTGPEGLTSVMRGDVQLFVDAAPIIVPQVKAGTIKALVVTGRSREPELPDVQTIAEAGFPAAQAEAWFGLVAPTGTPTAIVARLNQEIGNILALPEVQQRLRTLSFQPLVKTAEEFRSSLDEDHKRWGAIIREAGIKLD